MCAWPSFYSAAASFFHLGKANGAGREGGLGEAHHKSTATAESTNKQANKQKRGIIHLSDRSSPSWTWQVTGWTDSSLFKFLIECHGGAVQHYSADKANRSLIHWSASGRCLFHQLYCPAVSSHCLIIIMRPECDNQRESRPS